MPENPKSTLLHEMSEWWEKWLCAPGTRRQYYRFRFRLFQFVQCCEIDEHDLAHLFLCSCDNTKIICSNLHSFWFGYLWILIYCLKKENCTIFFENNLKTFEIAKNFLKPKINQLLDSILDGVVCSLKYWQQWNILNAFDRRGHIFLQECVYVCKNVVSAYIYHLIIDIWVVHHFLADFEFLSRKIPKTVFWIAVLSYTILRWRAFQILLTTQPKLDWISSPSKEFFLYNCCFRLSLFEINLIYFVFLNCRCCCCHIAKWPVS